MDAGPQCPVRRCLHLEPVSICKDAYTPRECTDNLYSREAVDVEGATCRRATGNQYLARAPGRTDPLDHDLGGCHPQLLRSRISREAGRIAGALYPTMVHGDEARELPVVLRGILWLGPFQDGRGDRGDA